MGGAKSLWWWDCPIETYWNTSSHRQTSRFHLGKQSRLNTLPATKIAPKKMDGLEDKFSLFGNAYVQMLLLMDKILHHLGWLQPYK